MAPRLDYQVDLLAPGWDYRLVNTRSEPKAEVSHLTRLVRAATEGDREAFGRLYDLHARMVHGVLMARVPLSVVDDLVQDVFMMALRRLNSLRRPASFGPWIAAIARNAANDFHRRPRPEDQTADMPETEHKPGSVTDDPQALLILDAIRKLPEAYRETLILRLVEDMNGPEIAARTGMTHGSVRVNLHRGMQMLRDKLTSSSGGHPGLETS